MKDDDLRWLYRDDEPEDTRVLPQGEFGEPGYPAPGAASSGYPRPVPGAASSGYAHPVPEAASASERLEGPTRRRRRRRHPVRRFILTVVVLWLVFMLGTPIFAWMRIDVVEGFDSALPSQPGTAVLLVGSDGRDDLTPEEQRRLGTGSTEGRRTDTMMVLYTAPNGRSVLLGLPRDSFVEIPGRGDNKLNAAYAFGGAPLLIEAVEHNTGIRIDGYLEIGMAGLANMVDAVGGIEVCPESPMQDADAHLDIPAGCQVLDGPTALAYARMRKSDPRGDIGRMERQREVIGKIVSEALSPATLLNPVSYWQLNMAAAGSLARTDDTGIPTMFGAGIGLVSGFTGAGISMTVPLSNPDAQTSAGSSVLWDDDAADEVFRAIASGDAAALEKYHE